MLRSLVALILKTSDPSTKETRKRAQKDGVLYDATGGDQEKSMIILSTNQVILSNLKPKEIKKRRDEYEDFEF